MGMRVIICGAGQVGSGIARQLAAENNDVVVIDQQAELVTRLEETVDVRGIIGHGSHPEVLERAGAADADMLIAVTFSDETNMIATQVAHSLFKVPLKVARVRAQAYLRPEWQNMFNNENMPIDVIISPEIEVGKTILRRLQVPGAFETIDFADGAVQVVGARIEEGAPGANTMIKQLRELLPQVPFTPMAIWRGERLFVPTATDQMVANDEVYFVAAKNNVSKVLEILGHTEEQARRLVIVGAGNIGLYAASAMEQHQSRINVKIIEHRKEQAERAADHLSRTVVLHGSGLDQTILREAGVPDAEAVITVTNNDESNILTGLIAKKLGATRVMALINNQDYGELLESLDIDAYIDPRATTVSTILQHVRRGRIKGLHSVKGGAGEIIEAEALETSTLVGQPVGKSRIPDGIRIGAVVRDKTVFIPDADLEIQSGDRVILFAEHDMVQDVEHMFRVSLDYF